MTNLLYNNINYNLLSQRGIYKKEREKFGNYYHF